MNSHCAQFKRLRLSWYAGFPPPRAGAAWVTVHVAAISRPADIARIFEANYNRYQAGSKLNYEIDFERGY